VEVVIITTILILVYKEKSNNIQFHGSSGINQYPITNQRHEGVCKILNYIGIEKVYYESMME
jgi:hypothetical protein